MTPGAPSFRWRGDDVDKIIESQQSPNAHYAHCVSVSVPI